MKSKRRSSSSKSPTLKNSPTKVKYISAFNMDMNNNNNNNDDYFEYY
jgi:hypothetical protein